MDSHESVIAAADSLVYDRDADRWFTAQCRRQHYVWVRCRTALENKHCTCTVAIQAIRASMKRYYFDIGETIDSEGKPLADLAAAQVEAQRLLSVAVRTSILTSGECKAWFCVVRDENGHRLARTAVAILVESLDEPLNGLRVFRPAQTPD